VKNILIAAACCVGVFSMPMTVYAGSPTPTKVKGCDKEVMSVECVSNFLKADKVIEDLAAGRKPNLELPVSPGSLGDLGKLLSR
jgi:hypothetical protein